MLLPPRSPALLLLAALLQAQGPVAPKAGLVYLAEGDVLLNCDPIAPGQTEFLFVEEGGTIRTAIGRAELLLGASNYLRLGENTTVHMLSGDLSAIELKLEAGALILEIGRMPGKAPITLQCPQSKIQIERRGLYRIDATPAQRVKVFEGRAEVLLAAGTSLLTGGWMIDLMAGYAPPRAQKFPRKKKDAFELWSADRSAFLAKADQARRTDPTTLGGDLQPMYSPQTSPRAKRFPDGRSN